MGLYKNNNGVLSPIAGRGKAEYGASTVRTGTITIPQNTVAGSFRVDFSDAMPDSNYIVNWYFDDCADGDAGRLVGAINRDANGFWLYYFGGFTKDVIIKYTAFKLYTDNEYNGLIEDVAGLNELAEIKTYRDTTTGVRFAKSGRVVTVTFEQTGNYLWNVAEGGLMMSFPSGFELVDGLGSISWREPLNNKRLGLSNTSSLKGIVAMEALENVRLRGGITYVTN